MKETLHTRKVPNKCEGPNFGVGSIGKVKVLMMQELNSASLQNKPSKAAVAAVSVHCFESRKRTENEKRTKSKSDHHRKNSAAMNPNIAANYKVCQIRSPHPIPMLGSEDVAMGKGPVRVAPERRRTQFVNVVDLKCWNGNSGKRFSSPLANQIRRLRFSRLSAG